ncbi:MAG: hypothetical protein ACT4TC_07040 [Myxococcaceae bacterium]
MTPANVAVIAEEELPDELQALDAKERTARVQQVTAERKKLEDQVQKLARDRDEWLVKNGPAKKDRSTRR